MLRLVSLALCAALAPPGFHCPDANPTLQAHIFPLMQSLLPSFMHMLLSEAPFNNTTAVSV